ncbi:type II secretion system F family protein [Corticibacter populi]|uniref:Type II secretion system F family protein n=1 Tax=Corticibacter populi TaxID=1550736 RepID=A0A3M6QVH1_9BURK|nr:type II secretion system F family protein [Corticibacter populi]RMX06881.1 type II secretion system F family protein [Corticibacter populi]RZS32147.1 tight adherence protein C [Corticibacter populi]
MTPRQLFILSLGLAALGVALWAAALLWRLWRSARASAHIGQTLQAREQAALAQKAAALATPSGAARDQQLLNPLASARAPAGAAAGPELATGLQPPAWLDSGVARALLAEEDRKLLDQAGISPRNGSMLYVASRAVLAVALPLLAVAVLQPGGMKALMVGFFGFGIGLMAPKWYVQNRASRRREQVVEELPLFVDLLRLLQGVGLSIDQSLQILASEFGSVLRVLGGELALANQLYASGRSREQSFQRLANLSADDDMTAVVSLLVQVDRHGGAVQEPLKQFSMRLREKRQAAFKEKIGKITVKMTGVMVLTLLPALLVITAGPGFMAVIRSLSKMGGNG